MIILTGQVYNPRFLPAREDEKKAAVFYFTIATRKPGKIPENEMPNIFHNCVAFGNTAERMNDFYGGAESKGRWISAAGAWRNDSRTYDPSKESEKVHCPKVVITKEMLTALGFKLAEDNQKQSVGVRVKHTVEELQFIVNGFNLIGNNPATTSSPESSAGTNVTGFVVEDEGVAEEPAATGSKTDDDLPF